MILHHQFLTCYIHHDKGKGKQHYHQFNATWVPDVIRLTGDGGMPELLEIKNYSPLVGRTKGREGPTEYVGHEYSMGNTEEALKWRVLGTRQRAVPAAGPYDHKTGTGYVKAHVVTTPTPYATAKPVSSCFATRSSAACLRMLHATSVGSLATPRVGGLTQPTTRSVRRLARSCRSTRSASPRTS